MATQTMDNEADRSANGEDEDQNSELASLRERLMRALAETENTRRQGARRVQDAQQYAITNFARELPAQSRAAVHGGSQTGIH